MRILVHEFASGGGLAGQEVPASLDREGAAMLRVLLEDLAAIGRHRLVTTADTRFPLAAPAGVEVVTLSPGDPGRLDALMASADAVWLVAPETGRCLERLAARAERQGAALLGPGPAAIRRASDKGGLPRRLGRRGVRCPPTRVLGRGADGAEWRAAARKVGYPVVVKPRRGAGSVGVSLARDGRELGRAIEFARQVGAAGALLLQAFMPGVAASVSLLADGRRAMALAVNSQSVAASPRFCYRGGTTPLEHPLAGLAADTAVRACEALPGLRGYVGVDLVLTDREAVVIEVNPRLTTAYLGVRASLGGNIAVLALAACAGTLPAPPAPGRRVRFSAGGRIVSATPVGSGLARSGVQVLPG